VSKSVVLLVSIFVIPTTIYADKFRIGVPPDGSLPVDGFQTLLEDTKRLAKLDREVSLNDVADLSILNEGQRELGIK
jgi:hypothetical protein